MYALWAIFGFFVVLFIFINFYTNIIMCEHLQKNKKKKQSKLKEKPTTTKWNKKNENILFIISYMVRKKMDCNKTSNQDESCAQSNSRLSSHRLKMIWLFCCWYFKTFAINKQQQQQILWRAKKKKEKRWNNTVENWPFTLMMGLWSSFMYICLWQQYTTFIIYNYVAHQPRTIIIIFFFLIIMFISIVNCIPIQKDNYTDGNHNNLTNKNKLEQQQ